MLAFDGPGCHPGDDPLGEEDVEQEGWGEDDDYRSEHAAPVAGVPHCLDHVEEAHGDGAHLWLVGENHRHEVLIPDGDEVEDRHRDEARLDQREHDAPEGSHRRAAVDGGGFLVGGGEVLEEGKEEERSERHVHRDVEEDEQPTVVGQSHPADQAEERHDDHDGRDAQGGGDEVLHHAVALEAEAAEHVRRRSGDEDDGGATDGGVDHRVHEVGGDALRLPCPYVVVEVKAGLEAEHVVAEDLLARREAGEEHPTDEDEGEDDPGDDEDIGGDEAFLIAAVQGSQAFGCHTVPPFTIPRRHCGRSGWSGRMR